MAYRLFTAHLSSMADCSAHSNWIHIESLRETNNVRMAIRYRNSAPAPLYEIDLDANDLRALAKLCVAMAEQLDANK
jgi:hypothetical protein